MKLKVKKVRDNAILPTRGSEKAAGIDLYACIDEPVFISGGESKLIPTGIACEFPKGYFGGIVPRSSVGIRRGLMLSNNFGICDEDYRGEIMMSFTKVGVGLSEIKPGERLAQMVLLPYVLFDIEETDTLSETKRGEGGFGSTGK